MGKLKLAKKLASAVKKRLKSYNSTDNMSSSGPIDARINSGLAKKPSGYIRQVSLSGGKYTKPTTHKNLKTVIKKDGRKVIVDK